MSLRHMVVITLIAALCGLAWVGQKVFHRDRDALFARFGQERAQGVANAVRGFAGDVTDIEETLELVSTLLESSETPQQVVRTLRATATVKREFLAVYGRTAGETTRVEAIDAPPGSSEPAAGALEQELAAAADSPGTLFVSGPLAAEGPARWYRVFARRPRAGAPAVAVAVDTTVLLSRLKVQRSIASRRAFLDGEGRAAPGSDPELAAMLASEPARFAPVLERARHGETGTAVLDAPAARELSLPDSAAVAIGVPLSIDRGPPWTLLVVSSTASLDRQQQTIVQRVVAGSTIVLLLLLGGAAYVLRSTYRARVLRDRVRDAERLAHTGKLVTAGQLAAGIAHEIGTPLNVARGRVELSLSHLGATHAEADNHRIVISEIDRVTRLIQQLLDYVRPAPAMVETLDLAAVLPAVQRLLQPQASKRGVSLEVEAEPARLRANPDQIQQILVNLTVNAIDACEKGGHVTLVARADRGRAVLEVADDGHGISREDQKQVFDPFYTTKKRGQGTGLGLWVVAQLVRQQGAEIELESKPARGTTVRVTWAEAA